MDHFGPAVSRRQMITRGPAVVAGTVAALGATASPARPSFAVHEIRHKGPGILRVAACQVLTEPDVARSTATTLEWIETAAKDDVDVVLFPEACLCGYAGGDYWKNADPQAFRQGEQRVIETSKQLNIAVVVGTAHWEGEAVYNDLLVIDKGGRVRGRYSKTHLAEPWPKPGGTLPVYTVAGVRSCFIICHDVRYPELVRLPAAAGAQICYFSSHESGLNSEHKLSAYHAMPVARATENGIFLIMANAPADPKTLRGSHGNSKIVHPDGNVLTEAGYFEQRLVTTNIRIKDANRSIAKRAINDKTILKQWMRDGAGLVTVQD